MKNKLLFLALAVVLFTCKVQAQTAGCGTDSIEQQMRALNPDFAFYEIERNIYIKSFIDGTLKNRTGILPTYTIPVVVHVLFEQGTTAGNISYAQIQSQINALNNAFARNYATFPAWAVNTNIQFCLAANPAGSANWTASNEPGVMRYAIPTATPYYNTSSSATGQTQLLSITHPNVNLFPMDKYLNVWIVNQIDNANVTGYGTIPSLEEVLKGVVIRYDVFGDNSIAGNNFPLNPQLDQGKILAHHVGHYLNLEHIYHGPISSTGCYGANGNTSTNDACDLNGDFICDIAPCTTSSFNCGSTIPNTCAENYTIANPNDMVESFMSSADDNCINTFTRDQSLRMEECLIRSRSELWSTPNLVTTGVMAPNGCSTPLLTAAINYNSRFYSYPGNSTISFSNPNLPGNTATQWAWSFPGATPSASTSASQQVTYNAPGTYVVTLTVTNAAGASLTNTEKVTITQGIINIRTQANWYFGEHAAISFATGAPVQITPSSINSIEATACISDPLTGDLLFYTDGITVWDAQHNAMPNGAGLNGSPNTHGQAGCTNFGSAQQGALIVPDPANDPLLGIDRYYIFTVPDAPGNCGSSIVNPLSFTIVDMNLNAGLGDVVAASLNTPVPAFGVPGGPPIIVEGSTAISHSNNRDWWVIVHGATGFFQDKILAYLVTPLGVTNCVVSPSFTVGFNNGTAYINNLEASPDGRLLVWKRYVAIGTPPNPTLNTDPNVLFILCFDNSTGNAALASTIQGGGRLSTSFSPNSRYLYYHTDRVASGFTRADLTDPLNPVVTPLPAILPNVSAQYYMGMQLGPDYSIYFAMNNFGIGRINNPDEVNPALVTSTQFPNFFPPPQVPNVRNHFNFPNIIDAWHGEVRTPNFTLAYPATNCASVEFTAESGCWERYTKNWDFGDGTTAGNLNTVTHTYAQSGTYTVTCTFTLGTGAVTTTQQVGVVIPTAPPVIQGPANPCAALTPSPQYTVPYVPGATYIWTAPGGINNPDDNVCDVNWGITGTGTVSVTIIANANCTTVCSLTVTVVECCTNPPAGSLSIQGGTTSTSLTTSSGVTQLTGNIFIQGEFIVDNICSFGSPIGPTPSPTATVYMAPGTRIRVLDMGTLNLGHCIIQGCAGMWQGIVSEDGSLVFTSPGTTILDALIAIDYLPGAGGLAGGGRFINNNTGIHVAGSGLWGVVMIAGCEFSTTGTFKPHTYNIGQYGRAGILIENMSMPPTISNNYFHHLNNGIICQNTTISVTNSHFDNIRQYDLNTPSYYGSAIFANGSGGLLHNLTVTPWSGQTTTIPTFDDCRYGVFTNAMSVTVNNCRMNNISNMGIRCRNSNNGRTVTLNSNTITANGRGIDLFNNAGASQLQVAFNRITTTQPGAFGIRVAEVPAGANNANINDNWIRNLQGGQGINLMNVNDASLTYNNIGYPIVSPSVGYRGINIQNSDDLDMTCNQVAGPGINTNSPVNYGIQQSMSERCFMKCNSVGNSRIGIEFGGDNSGTEFVSNTMINHRFGLQLNSVAIIGTQTLNGNRWIPPFTGGWWANMQVPSAPNIANSRFFVNGTPGTTFNPSNNAPGWFTTDPGTQEDCDHGPGGISFCGGLIANPGDNEITQLDLMVAQGEYNPELFPTESESMARLNLYEKLLRHPDLINVHPSLQIFYDDYYNTVISGQADLRLSIEELALIYRDYEAMFNVVDSSRNAVNDSLNVLGQLPPDPATDAIIASLLLQLQNIHTAMDNLMQQMDAAQNDMLQDLLLENSAQLPVELPEINEQIINDVYLRTVADGNEELTPEQVEQVWSIAQQCPYSGGPAVYRARVLYELVNETVEYDDETVCLSQGIYRQSQPSVSNTELVSQLSLHPNPANESVTVAYTPATDAKCLLTLTDIAGQLVKSITLPCKENKFAFRVNELPTGLYIVKLYNNGLVTSRSKLTIIR